MSRRPRTLEEACSRIGVRLLVVFGSRAPGPGRLPPGPRSDLDLAVALHRSAPRPSLFDLNVALYDDFPGKILDTVFLADADPLFRWEIMDRGLLLYGDVDDFLETRAYAYRDFVDSADLRRLERTLSDRKLNRIREQLRAAAS